jgi:hypothetical protein
MKTNKTLSALALLFGLGISAQAVQDVFINGSTAFRPQVYNALKDLNLTVANSATSGGNTWTFNGTIADHTGGHLTIPAPAEIAVCVHCSFDGSVQGVNAAQNNVNQVYFQSDGTTTVSHPDDLAFSDIQQASTIYNGIPILHEIVAPDATNVGEGVAVQPFLWAANCAAFDDGCSNINQNNIWNLFNQGFVTLNCFTGNAGDSNTPVVLTGRDNSSGTRITSQQLGQWKTFKPIIQYTINGNTTDPATLAAGFPWALAPADSQGPHDSGYSSGGKVAHALAYGNCTNGPAVSYLSFADAYSGLQYTGAAFLTYQGVPPQIGPTQTVSGATTFDINAVINGRYDDWSYEHLYSNANDSVSGVIVADIAPALVSALEYEIGQTSPQTAILIGNMNVNREGGDGIPLTQGNY